MVRHRSSGGSMNVGDLVRWNHPSETDVGIVVVAPKHERSNTLLAALGNFENTNTKHTKLAMGKRREAQTTNTEQFPGLPLPGTAQKTLCWVSNSSGTNKHMTANQEYILAPVPESRKVKNKAMKELSTKTIHAEVDGLNFQERESELVKEVAYWKHMAEDRARLLDEMEGKNLHLNRELDDMWDKYC